MITIWEANGNEYRVSGWVIFIAIILVIAIASRIER